MWRWILAAFVLLLALSNAYRLVFPADGIPSAEQRVFESMAQARSRSTAGLVRVAYRDLGPRSAPAVLLIHGTPVSSAAVLPLARELASRFRVIVPDLPGFGGSSRRLPDYSFLAHAGYLQVLLERLALDSVHVVAYSQGGGVALSLAEQSPQHVRSIVMVSAIGVQELELLGDYRLNRALYLAQLGVLGAAEWLLPHFGYLDTAILGTAYARNVLDSDQRPLRGILEQYSEPMLILHGRDDSLVPLAAAVEHHRIVPQSELTLLDGGHMLVIEQPATLAGPVSAFLRRVELGTATARNAASAERLGEAAIAFDWREVPAFEGLTLVIIVLLLALATYVSEDLACITAGLMVARGMLEFLPATAACLAGIFTGDLLLFLAGRFLGSPALTRAPLRWLVSKAQVTRSREWFHHRGPIVIFVSRFIPGTRLPTYVTAGLLRMSLLRFSAYFLLAAVLWTPLLVGGAYLVGTGVLEFVRGYQRYSIPIVLALALSLLIAMRIVFPLFSFRGRRMLVSKWRRLTRWEFWPMWAFYPPLFVYILYLGCRYRGLTLFTAANPAIPAGGFVGESKSAILDGLAAAGKRIARYRKLQSGAPADRTRQVIEFMAGFGLDYPIVLKPDVGERGEGVVIARDAATVADYLADGDQPIIVQEFAPGQEFGVFYYRLPGEKTGHIFAITDKRPPSVVGDGEHTLEYLILADERAVCMAETFLARYADRLFDVPANGESIALVEVGTHCMGCMFRDGEWLRTAALEAEIDRVSQTFDGFFFGRYDIRTPDVEAFRQGRDYKIVELNGVTSEATNIYDPSNSLLSAYRILRKQWELAFKIGAANRLRGAAATPVSTLLSMLRARAS